MKSINSSQSGTETWNDPKDSVRDKMLIWMLRKQDKKMLFYAKEEIAFNTEITQSKCMRLDQRTSRGFFIIAKEETKVFKGLWGQDNVNKVMGEQL